MKMKRFAAMVLAGAMAMSLAACGETEEAPAEKTDAPEGVESVEPKVFSLGHCNPADPDDQYHFFCEELNKNLQENCGGAIQFEIYSDSKLGSEPEMFQYVSEGSMDAVCISNNIASGSIPQLQVLDLPYFFDSEDEYQHLVDDEAFLAELTPIFEDQWNMHQFGPVLDASWRTLFTKGKAIKSFDDVQNLKVRVTTNRVHEAAYKAMGTIPAVIAWGECYTAFQQNVIDGLDVGVPIAKTMGFWEVSDYCSRVNPFPILCWPMINLDVWNSLSEEEQGWITEAATDAAMAQRQHQRDMETKFAEEMKADGIEFFDLDLAPFKEATAGVRDQFKSEIGEDFFDQCVETVETYRASK